MGNGQELLAFVRKRFTDVVAFADEIEGLHDQADSFDASGDVMAAQGTRGAIDLAWQVQLIAGEQFKMEFNRLRARTIYAEFSADEWQEIADLDATEKELARRLAERAFRN